MSRRGRGRWRWAALFLAAGLAALAFGVWRFGGMALEPRQRAVSTPPPAFDAQPATLTAPDQPRLTGWLIPEEGALCGVLLVMHGRGGARDDMLARAALFRAAGFAVALFDFQGHGESEGQWRGLGWREAEDARRMAAAARAFRPGAPFGVVGVSLGASAAAHAGSELGAGAFVFEALFTSLLETTARRMPGPEPVQNAIAWVVLLQLPIRLGYFADEHRPVDRVGALGAPVLFLAGDADPWATPAQSRALLAAAGPEAELVWFAGAPHQDLYEWDRALYEATTPPFLRAQLCPDLSLNAPPELQD